MVYLRKKIFWKWRDYYEASCITINRMYGSNGRIIGRALAQKLGIGFYDQELISMASRKKTFP